MKKVFLILTVVSCLIGCQEKSDSEKFADDYNVSEDNSVVYLEEDDLNYQLTHGTHVLFIGDSNSEDSKEIASALVEAVNNHSGIVIYYYSNASDDLLVDVAALLEEVSETYVVFIKEGEIIAVSADINNFEEYLSLMEDNIAPGCNEC